MAIWGQELFREGEQLELKLQMRACWVSFWNIKEVTTVTNGRGGDKQKVKEAREDQII